MTQTRSNGHARRLHLVDIENLVGRDPREVSDDEIEHAARRLYEIVTPGPADLVVVGCNPRWAIRVKQQWPGPHRLVTRRGPDGGETGLIELWPTELVASRFTELTIASGDGAFAPYAARCASGGARVVVVARHGSLSTALRLSSHRQQLLPPVVDISELGA